LSPKAIKILGLVITILGFVLAAGAAMFDLFTGGKEVGDSQMGAFFISLAILLFGFLLLQFAASKELKDKITEIGKLHKNVKAEPPKGINKIFGPLGLVGALVGVALILVLVLKDYEPLLTFNIGPLQMLAIFTGTSLAVIGLGFMSLGYAALTASMKPMILQLEVLTKEEKAAEAPPGKPMKVKRVKPLEPVPETGEAEPTASVEVVTETPSAEVPVEPAPTPEPGYTYGAAELMGASEAVLPTEPAEATEEATEGYAAVPEPEYGEPAEATEEATEGYATVTEPEYGAPVEEPVTYEGEATAVTAAEEEPTAAEGEWTLEDAERQVTDLAVEMEQHLGAPMEEAPPEDDVHHIPGPELAPAEVASAEISPTVAEASEEPEVEEYVEGFVCPNCKSPVGEDDMECPTCGVSFAEEEQEVVIEDGVVQTAEGEASSGTILEGILGEISRLDEEETPVEDEGAAIPSTCPKCGRNLKPRWQSCPYCGLEFR
jgi:hypothetical protein